MLYTAFPANGISSLKNVASERKGGKILYPYHMVLISVLKKKKILVLFYKYVQVCLVHGNINPY